MCPLIFFTTAVECVVPLMMLGAYSCKSGWIGGINYQGETWSGASRAQSHQFFSFPLKAACSPLRGTDSCVIDEESDCATAGQNGCPHPGGAGLKRWKYFCIIISTFNYIIMHKRCLNQALYKCLCSSTVQRAPALMFRYFAVSHPDPKSFLPCGKSTIICLPPGLRYI